MDPAAELSSVSTALEELTRRVAAIAEVYQRAKREDLAADLFAVESLLDTARRRLAKVVASRA
ncbi:MAG: hypothetical protein M3394_06250 [Actinomycetota bacterium]|nr:hypothetical protein [Actinomycetota bacterium]